MKYLLIPFWILLVLAPVAGQNKSTLYGIATNDKNEVLIGASVFWKDTREGTITDTLGRFWIPRRNQEAVLVVSYIAHEPAEVVVLPQEDSLWIEVSGINVIREVTISEASFDNRVSMLETRNIESISSKELRKAPCCNLSESFETNGAVDVVYSDAITGVKEIQMLGLRGVYSQFLVENRPTLQGIATPFAFELIPGTWLSSIQLAKGASTVKNGYAGITGQINAELVKPHQDAPVFVNAFGSSGGRGELNVHLNKKGKGKISNGLLLHGSFQENRWDMNDDNFYDLPNRRQVNGLYRAFYESDEMCAQFNVQALSDRRLGGQIGLLPGQEQLFAVDQRNDRVEVWGKMGREGLFGRPYIQMGNMLSASWHRANSAFGANSYNATQRSLYWQTLYETIISNTNHKLVIAPSFQYDDIDEQVNEGDLSRTEAIPGTMLEYTFSRPNLDMEMPDLVVVAGVRADWNSRFGWFVTPRVSAKYNFSQTQILRMSAGYGYRSPNIMAENISVLASNRSLNFASDLSYEAAWNYGINYTREFQVMGRTASVSVEAYRTDFDRQILVDVDQSPTQVSFYNSPGPSYATSAYALFQISPLKGLDLKMAYKWNDVKATFADGVLRTLPLVARHRALLTIDYNTPDDKWMFNMHMQMVGSQRLPDNSQIPHEYTHHFPANSPNYGLLSAQITRRWKKLEVYAGGENLTQFMQHHAIIAANEPWSPYFNGSQIWAPTMGAVGYAGVRWSINDF